MVSKKTFLAALLAFFVTFSASCSASNESGAGSSGGNGSEQTGGGNGDSENPDKNGGAENDNGIFDFGSGTITATSAGASAAIPDYSDVREKMHFYSWNALQTDAKNLEYFEDAAFDSVYIQSYEGYSLNSESSITALDKLLSDYDARGISAYWVLGNGWQHRGNGAQLGRSVNPEYFYKSLQKVKDAGYDFTKHESFKGISVYDEPGGRYGVEGSKIYNDFDYLVGNVDLNGDGKTDTWKFRYDLSNAYMESMLAGWFGEDGYEIRTEDGEKYVYAPSQWEIFKSLWSGENAVFKHKSIAEVEFHINVGGGVPATYDFTPMIERVYPVVFGDGGFMRIATDRYALRFNDVTVTPEIPDGLATLYSLIYEQKKRFGAEFSAFVAPAQISRVNGAARGDDLDGIFSEYEMRFQIYYPMAFGADNISYFVYYTQLAEVQVGSTYVGVVDKTTKSPTKAYEGSKKANNEAQKMYKYLSQFNLLGINGVYGSRNKQNNAEYKNPLISNVSDELKLRSHARLKRAESTRDTLICAYKNELYDGFFFMNIEDPYYKRKNTLTVSFNNASRVLIAGRTKQSLTSVMDVTYGEFSTRVAELKNGEITVDIDFGDALFMIPLA